MGRVTVHDTYEDKGEIKHVVIGHSQIHGLWNIKFTGDDEHLNYPIRWVVLKDGRADELVNIIQKEVQDCKKDIKLRITAIIWQNVIPSITIDEVNETVLRIEAFMSRTPRHKLALPECQFVPEQEGQFYIYTRYWPLKTKGVTLQGTVERGYYGNVFWKHF